MTAVGSGDAARWRPAATLVLLHAFPVDRRMWAPLADALAGPAPARPC